MTDIRWIDQFFNSVKDYISVREEDMVLIYLPNQVYNLNKTAYKILDYLYKGRSIEEITGSFDEKQKEEIHNFFCDLRAIISGCLREGDERKAVEIIPFDNNMNKLPILSEIAVTYKCNLKCSFCYVGNKEHYEEEMSTKKIKRIIDIIKNEAKVPSLSFTGGEPTIRNDIFDLIKYARKTGLRVNLITNGIKLSDRRFVKRLKKSGLNSAQVSVESADEKEHNMLVKNNAAFSRTIEGIKNLKEENITVHTNTTINSENFNTVHKLIDLAQKLGLDRVSMNLIMPTGTVFQNRRLSVKYSSMPAKILYLKKYAEERSIEFIWYSPIPMCIFNPIANNLGNKSCAACNGLLSIDPYGNILPCSSYKKPMGNLFEREFRDIWFSEGCSYFKQMKYVPQQCTECGTLKVCAGGCPIYWDYFGTEELNNKDVIAYQG